MLLAVVVGACGLVDPSPSIAGPYTLTSVDNKALPCCGAVDSTTGAKVTVLSGTLTLGSAAPEAFATTPAGYYPESCVHAVPNGSTAPSEPRCGDGSFSLSLVERLDYADGSSKADTLLSSGRYAWSDQDALIKLVDVPMLGSVSLQTGGAVLAIQRATVMGTYGPTYTFTPERLLPR